MPIMCKELIQYLNQIVPPHYAEEWDNVGLLVGHRDSIVQNILLALDINDEVIQEAINYKVDLIITHHPFIFKSLKKINSDSIEGKQILTLIENKIKVFTMHTNLDIVQGGTNDVLADQLKLTELQILKKMGAQEIIKLVVYVPSTDTKRVQEALFEAGAGNIGNYQDCSFILKGEGTFTPKENTNPYIGKINQREEVEEDRIETIVPKKYLQNVLKKMIEVHPYEEVAYDLFPLQNEFTPIGLGRVGKLKERISIEELSRSLKKILMISHLRVIGDLSKKVEKLAICTGSGMSLLNNALSHDVDVYITSDVKYHEAWTAIMNEIPVIDAGHFGTENIIIPIIEKHIKEFNSTLNIITSNQTRDPFQFI